jgi:hypothetical protein
MFSLPFTHKMTQLRGSYNHYNMSSYIVSLKILMNFECIYYEESLLEVVGQILFHALSESQTEHIRYLKNGLH